MRIGFMAQPFDRMSPPVEGGSLAMWTSQAARICSRRGHETVIFGNHGGLLGESHVHEEGVDYNNTPTGWNRALNKLNGAVFKTSRRFGRIRPVLPRFASSWQDLGYATEVGRRSKELRLDILQVMNYSQFVPVIRRLNPKFRISLHMHCEWLTQLDRRVIENRISHADLIVGCSEYITRKIANCFPEFEKRCVTVANAAHVTTDDDRVMADPNYVLFIGRISPEKGVHDLVRAFHEVLKRFPEARLHIGGGLGSAPYEFLVGLSDDPQVTALRVFYEQKGDGKRDPYAASLEREAGEELGKRIIF
jgi:glycosyltransferase involved in cell wall biosynthesis